MARPQKQTIDYFPHYVNSGKTKLILQNEFGNEGYAFWYQLLELLCSTENQVYDYNNPASWRLLLAETHTSEDNAIKMLQLLADLGTIDPELHKAKIIWSQNLIENLDLVYRRRMTGVPKKPVIVNKNRVNVNKSTQTKLNNTKLNNIYIVIFNLWNTLGLISHKKLTDQMKRVISGVLENHTEADIKQAMSNYAVIVHSPEYWFTYKWTLNDFLRRGLEQFLDLETAKQNYRKEKANGKTGGHTGKVYTDPASLRHEEA